MEFFNSAIDVLQTLVIALGAGLGIWGVINLLEGYGNDNPGAKSQGIKHFIAGDLICKTYRELLVAPPAAWPCCPGLRLPIFLQPLSGL